MERIDSAGEDLEDTVRDQVEDYIKNAALNYLSPFLPFLSSGESGPSEIDLAVEKILNALNETESRIINAIIAESVAQNGIDWSALKFDSAYYFSYPHHDRATLYYLLNGLLERSTTLRLEFQQNRTQSNPNRSLIPITMIHFKHIYTWWH